SGEYKVAVSQQSSSATNGRTFDGRDQRLVEIQQRICELCLGTRTWPRRVLQKIVHVVASGERVTGSVPDHNIYIRILRRFIEGLSESYVHRRSHRILLLGSI